MSRKDLQGIPLGEDLVAIVAQRLDSGEVPNVLCGNYLLTIYGVPTVVNDAAFVFPDDKITVARGILCNANLNVCIEEDCSVIAGFRSSPPPVEHFHLGEDLYISLHRQSEVLPNIPDMTEPKADIISASDASLPRARIGYGNGAFSSTLYPVRIPSAACFVEACLINFLREVSKDDSASIYDLHYMTLVSYMVDYVYETGFLNLDSLPPRFKNFLVDAFIGECSSYITARDELVSSHVPVAPV